MYDDIIRFIHNNHQDFILQFEGRDYYIPQDNIGAEKVEVCRIAFDIVFEPIDLLAHKSPKLLDILQAKIANQYHSLYIVSRTKVLFVKDIGLPLDNYNIQSNRIFVRTIGLRCEADQYRELTNLFRYFNTRMI